MAAKTKKIIEEEENNMEEENTEQNELDPEKLKALKDKLSNKQGEDMPPKIVEEKKRGIRIGVVGSGQAGSRLAESFYNLGYDAVALNTAPQDLEHIKMPDKNKLLLDYSLGGASKELSIGQEAAELHKDAINELVNDKFKSSQVLVLAVSLGGGSGAGSCETLIEILSKTECPIVVMTVLPMSNEDAQTKNNALQTLSKLTKLAQKQEISNLIVIDNAKLELIYSDVSQFDFYEVANQAIVEPLDTFNTLSSQPSKVKPLDPMEFAKLLTDGEGLSVYGQMSVQDYTEDTAIAEAVVENLNSNILAGGFDLKQARYVGVIIAASKSVWDKVPAGSINYAMSMVEEICSNPKGTFKGIYSVDSDEDVVKVYSMFSGLSLPEDRVQQLKDDASALQKTNQEKDEKRNLSLKLDTGKEETVSQAEKVKEKIKANKSSFSKLTQRAVVDKRKK